MSKELNRIRARIQMFKERYRRAQEYVNEIERNPAATVIRRKFAYVFAGNEKRDPMGDGLDIEVRKEIYGGSGRVITSGKQVRITLRVLEPYALSVQRRTAIRTRAMAYAKSQMRQPASRKSIL